MRKRGHSLVVLAVFACIALAALCTESYSMETKVTIQVAGIRIVKPPYNGDMQMRAFNWFVGSTVSVLLTSNETGIIAVDTTASKITKFTDDKGTNLLAKKSRWGRSVLGSFPKISSDHKATVVEVNGTSTPAKGAKTLFLEGTIVLKFAKGKNVLKKTNIAAKVGTKFTVGDIPFEITRTGKPRWGRYKLSMSLKVKKGADKIAKVRFLDAAGQEIKSRRTMTMSSFGVKTFGYNLAKNVSQFTLEVSTWKDVKTVKCPVKLQCSIGF